MQALWIAGAFGIAYVVYRMITRPDPREQQVVQQLHRVLNEPQYRVKGKYEE